MKIISLKHHAKTFKIFSRIKNVQTLQCQPARASRLSNNTTSLLPPIYITSQSRRALSTSRRDPVPGSWGVKTPFVGEPIVRRGIDGPISGESRLIGVTTPLGGTGILRSSGELAIVDSGSPGI